MKNDNIEKGNIYKPIYYVNWEEKILYNLAIWKNGLAFKNINFTDSGKPVIKIAELKNGITSQTKFTQDVFDDSVYLKKGDMLFSWSGNPETSIDVFYYNLPNGWLNQHIFKIKTKDGVFYRYFFYILKYLKPNFTAIATNKQTTGLGHVTINDLKKIKIKLPPLEEQKKIASILSSLDDKIELNNRMNKILEEMAQTIFKEWFVNFNFPGEDGKPYKDSGGKMIESELGEIPEGWRVGTIGEYSKVKSGFAFKSSWWIDKGIPVIKIQNVSSENINIEECSFVDEDKYKAAEIFRVNAGDLLIAMTGATLGKFAIVPKLKKDALVNQRVGKFFLGDDPIKKLPFIYSLLKLSSISNIIVSLGTGSAQPNISPTDIENIKIVYPNEDILNKYNQYTEKIFIKIINARDENHKLASIRDTLLPRLMSGEIRVK
ncbi:hypothetical protein BHAMNSH16_00705 [Brachyspira hampsonii]|uniref:Type I restriction modification DNA specificity domain-containing protein n=3 Tax=Brachyspira hampsonii TaxID=1287055 RepID=A0AAC9TSA7_9SPIR|nr:restriction endonuclease subunit S [Brachyspira hampsonii]ASJ20254.1 hypothetical protein BHAMNSH16_00705 [Brachyspira hampsonii]